MRKYSRILGLLLILAIAAVSVAACGSNSGNRGLRLEDQQQDADALQILESQPLPAYSRSQLRANLTEIETAEAKGVETTSFFFTANGTKPIKMCKSVGAPIPITDSLSNPTQEQKDNKAPINNGGGNVTLDQMDPDGIYQGDGAGTYVLCIDSDGTVRANYWEGLVYSEFGSAHWDNTSGMIVSDGEPTFKFTTGTGVDPTIHHSATTSGTTTGG